MYNISVPIRNSNIKRSDRDRLLKELKRFDTKRVFVTLGLYETDEKKENRT